MGKKRKRGASAHNVSNEGNLPGSPEPDEIDEEDVQMVRNDPQLARLVSGMELPPVHQLDARSSRRKSPARSDEVLAEYERSGARSPASETKEGAAASANAGSLPAKTLGGELVQQPIPAHTRQESRRSDGDDAPHAQPDRQQGGNVSSAKQPEQQRSPQKQVQLEKEREDTDTSPELRLSDAKLKIGTLSESIVSSPYEHAHHLKSLLSLCTNSSPAIARMARLSLYLVLKDVAPGYTIRLPPREHERNEKLSKPVQRARDFERNLLSVYKGFLSHLQKASGSIRINSLHDHRTDKDAVQAVQCLSGFARSLAHFNCRIDVLRALVPRLAVVSSDITDPAASALSELVRSDAHGDASLEVVQLIAQLFRQHKCSLHPQVLQPLAAVKLDRNLVLKKREEEAKEELKRVSGANLSRKQRYKQRRAEREQARKQRASLRQRRKEGRITKEEQEEKDLEEQTKLDMAEAQALPDIEKRKRLQTLSLEAMFEVYFRVIKQAASEGETANSDSKGRCCSNELLDKTLTEVSRRVHFISIDYMGDLMACLRKLMQHASLSKLIRAKCLQSAALMLSGEGSALNIDPHEFHKQLYCLLDEALVAGEESGVLLRLVSDMILSSKAVTSARAAAFAKRLCTSALHSEHGAAIGALACVRQLLTKSNAMRILLENDEATGAGGSGGFKPAALDPDYANARETCAWELSLLAQSPSRELANAARETASLPVEEAPPAAPFGALSADEVAQRHNTTNTSSDDCDELNFFQFTPHPTSHDAKRQPLLHRLLRRNKPPECSAFDTTADSARV
jgi:nucleolar complex protein 3